MKKLIKIFAIIAALFAVLLIAAVIVLKVMFPPEKIIELAKPIISEAVRRDVEIKDAGISIFPIFGFKLEGINITNTERTVKIDKNEKLSELLKRSFLDPRLVKVEVNGKVQERVYEKDADLKSGDKVRILRRGFAEKESLFSLGEFLVEIKVMPLLKKEVVIKKILLDELTVLVEADRRGSFNFDDIIASDETVKEEKKPEKKKKDEKPGALPISFRMEEFEIRDAKIVYRNRKDMQEIVLGDIDQEVSFSMDPEMKNVVTKGLLEVKQIAVRGKGLPVSKSGMKFSFKHSLNVNLKAGNLKINEMRTGFQKTFLTVKGSVNGFDKPAKKLALDISTNRIDLGQLLSEVPTALSPDLKKMKAAGTMMLKLAINGGINAARPEQLPKVNGLLELKNIMFQYTDLPKSINSLDGNIKFTENSLDIPKLSLKLGDNPISFKAIVNNFKAPTIDVALNAALDLGIVKEVTHLPEGVSVSGEIKANVAAKGKVDPKDPGAIAVDGGVHLVNIVATTPEVKKPINLNGSFLFSNEELKLDKFVTKIGASSVTMNMSIRDYLGLALPDDKYKKTTKISYTMDSPLLDFNEMLGLKVKIGKGGAAAAEEAPESESSGDEPIIIPELPNISFDGKIRVAKLRFLTIPVSNGAIDLRYAKKKVNFGMNAVLFTGKISEKLFVSLTNPNSIVVTNSFSSVRMEANDFISNLNDLLEDDGELFTKLKGMDNTVYGKLDLKTKVKTHGITPNAFKKNLFADIYMKVYK